MASDLERFHKTPTAEHIGPEAGAALAMSQGFRGVLNRPPSTGDGHLNVCVKQHITCVALLEWLFLALSVASLCWHANRWDA